MGETQEEATNQNPCFHPFSILKRIVMGETSCEFRAAYKPSTFSILKRIVMGETLLSRI